MPQDPSEETIAADEEESRSAHVADRAPTEDEEAAADRARNDPSLAGDQEQVAEHFEEMTKKGVAEKGEGRID